MRVIAELCDDLSTASSGFKQLRHNRRSYNYFSGPTMELHYGHKTGLQHRGTFLHWCFSGGPKERRIWWLSCDQLLWPIDLGLLLSRLSLRACILAACEGIRIHPALTCLSWWRHLPLFDIRVHLCHEINPTQVQNLPTHGCESLLCTVPEKVTPQKVSRYFLVQWCIVTVRFSQETIRKRCEVLEAYIHIFMFTSYWRQCWQERFIFK